jgi:hypothetical protein
MHKNNKKSAKALFHSSFIIYHSSFIISFGAVRALKMRNDECEMRDAK